MPLITSPYLARVLGAEKQGVFSYTQSIVNVFVLFAMLGVTNYGSKTIAECRQSKSHRSQVFWNIYFVQAFVSIVCTIIYFVYLQFIFNNRFIAFLQSFYLIGAIIDINWLFFGVEDFKTTVTRNLIIRLLSVVLMFSFVKTEEDLWVYTLIMSGSTFCSNLVLWIFANRIIDLNGIKCVKWSQIKVHIKPNLVLFVPLLGLSVYHIMDKTMLGLLSSYEQVGYYYNADKVVNIPIGIINGIGTVMLPRMSALINSDNIDKSNHLFSVSLELVIAVSSAMCFGIASISTEFTPLFFGEGFDPCILLLTVLSPVLIVKGLSQTCRMQYLIPNNLEKIFIESVALGAIVNVTLNLLLIPSLNAMGAVLGTLGAETVACIWQIIRMSKRFSVLGILVHSIKYIVFGIIMFISVRCVSTIISNLFISIIVEIIVGFLTYISLCIINWKTTDNHIWKVISQR